jgi:hypothetical protein
VVLNAVARLRRHADAAVQHCDGAKPDILEANTGRPIAE